MQITVFGTPTCPGCKQVTEFLTASDVEYTYRSIGEDTTVESVEAIVNQPVRAVPVIAIFTDGGVRDVKFEELRHNVLSNGFHQSNIDTREMSL